MVRYLLRGENIKMLKKRPSASRFHDTDKELKVLTFPENITSVRLHRLYNWVFESIFLFDETI
jgi:hypothetical protein